MKIETIPSGYLINACTAVTLDDVPNTRSDFLLRAIKIVNTRPSPIRITSIAFTAQAVKKALRTFSYAPERLEERAALLLPLLNPFEKAPRSEPSIRWK